MSNLHLDGVKKHLGIIGEFKEFAMRGNVVDLAIGVVIGGAFGKIVTSMVGDILMPVIGWGTPVGGDLKDKFYSLEPAKTAAKTLAEAQKAGAVIAWGQFVTTIIDFIIVAFFIFLVVKLMNKMKTPPPPPPAPETPPQEKLLAEIRDLLKARS